MKVDNVIVFPTEPGTLTGQFGPTMQGATAPVVVDLRQRDGTALDLTGFNLTLYFWLTSTPGTVYEATGTFPVLADVATYTPSDDDVSTAGAFTMIVHASDGVTTHKSVPLAWQITADPAYGGGGSPNPALFLTAAEKAWLTQLPQVNGYLMQRTSIEAGETVTIPADHAMVVTHPFENDGSIEVNGRLVILGSAAEASRQEFDHAAVTAVYNHNLQRENVHGIADTRLLETQAGAQAKADAAQASAVQRANHTGTQLLETISDAGTMAAQSAANYYAKSEFTATPGAAEKPLKSDSNGNIYPQIVISGSYRIGSFYALQMPATGRTLVGHTTGSGSNMTCVGYYAGYARSYADAIAIGAYANPTKANQAVIGGDGGYGTSQINALTVVSGTSGGAFEGNGKSSTTAAQPMARIAWLWNTSTHATRKADLVLYARDYGGEREGLRIRGGGTEVMTAVNGAVPVARQLLATGAGATVDDVIAVLQNFGIAKQS